MFSKYEPIWELMSQRSFEVDPDCREENLTCVICHKLMVDACQGACGCQYCHQCIYGYMRGEGDKYCPGNKEECNERYLVLDKDVIRNARRNSMISKLRVKCPNKGCKEMKELSEMGNHLRTCSKQLIKCPYIKVGCANEGESKAVIEGHLNDEMFDHSRLLVEYVDNLTNELNEMKEKFEGSESKMAKMEEELGRMVERGEEGERRLNSLCRFYLNKTMNFVWRFENVSTRRLRPRVAQVFSINISPFRYDSPSFSLLDFTLCVRLEFGDDDIGLFCVVLEDPNDNDALPRAVTLSIIDQRDLSDHRQETFTFDEYYRLKAAPGLRAGHHAIGTPSLVTYSAIKDDPSVIVDDAIILSCVLHVIPSGTPPTLMCRQ